MKNRTIVLSVITASIYMPSAMAHTGHDHGHWLSNLIHASILVSAAAMALFVVMKLRKNHSVQKIKQGE